MEQEIIIEQPSQIKKRTFSDWSKKQKKIILAIFLLLFGIIGVVYIVLSRAATGDLGGQWVSSGTLPQQTHSAATVSANGYLYVLGGFNLVKVEHTKLNTDGSTGSWVADPALPLDLENTTAVYLNGYIYLMAGMTSGAVTGNSGQTYDVYAAKQNGDGTLGTWVKTTAIPPSSFPVAMTRGDSIYMFCTGGATTAKDVLKATPAADGTISSWVKIGTIPCLNGRQRSVTELNGRYWLAEDNYGPNGGTYASLMLSAPINTDGSPGTWTKSSSKQLYGSSAVFYGPYVYTVGGVTDWNTANTSVNAVWYAPLNADGTVGPWAQSMYSLSKPTTGAFSTVVNARAYIMGGADYNGVTYDSVVTAPLIMYSQPPGGGSGAGSGGGSGDGSTSTEVLIPPDTFNSSGPESDVLAVTSSKTIGGTIKVTTWLDNLDGGTPRDAKLSNVTVIEDNIGVTKECFKTTGKTDGRTGSTTYGSYAFTKCPVASSPNGNNYAKSYWVYANIPSGYHMSMGPSLKLGERMVNNNTQIRRRVKLHNGQTLSVNFYFVSNSKTDPAVAPPDPSSPPGTSTVPLPDYLFNSDAATGTADPNNPSTLTLLNQARQSAGLNPLTVSSYLTDAARRHCNEMFLQSLFTHYLYSDEDAKQNRDLNIQRELTDNGYTTAYPSAAYGQNLGNVPGTYSPTFPTVNQKGWMASPGHKVILLDPRWRTIGIAVQSQDAPPPGVLFENVEIVQPDGTYTTGTVTRSGPLTFFCADFGTN